MKNPALIFFIIVSITSRSYAFRQKAEADHSKSLHWKKKSWQKNSEPQQRNTEGMHQSKGKLRRYK